MSKLIRLTPDQVPRFWEAIKFSCVKADNIRKEDLPKYLNQLLHSLLSSKAQCFIRLSDNRQLQALMVTKIMADDVTGEKVLFVACLYSYEPVSGEMWKIDFEKVRQFALQQDCQGITTWTNNPRVWELCISLGFVERSRSFVADL